MKLSNENNEQISHKIKFISALACLSIDKAVNKKENALGFLRANAQNYSW